MSKQAYRTELGMISDILKLLTEYGRQGTIITTIARGANLSHYTAIDKCQKLVNFGLLESREYKRGHFFHYRKRNAIFVRTTKVCRVCTSNKNMPS